MALYPKGSAKVAPDTAFKPGSIVSYEHNNATLLAVITGTKGSRYIVLNERGRESDLAANRLYSFNSQLPDKYNDNASKVSFLEKLQIEGHVEAEKLDLEELWSLVHEEASEFDTATLLSLWFGKDELKTHVALRYALLDDKRFFKRKRDTFFPRTAEIVEELKRAEIARLEKERLKGVLIENFKERLIDKSFTLNPETSEHLKLLVDLAVGNSVSPAQHKEAQALIDECGKALNLKLSRDLKHRSFAVLESVGYFSKDTNLSILRNHFPVTFSDAALKEAEELNPQLNSDGRVDLTSLECITIDDAETLDMDDALSLEQTEYGYRLGVHITDVASYISKELELEHEAQKRTTSIYLPDKTYNMFPEILSNDKLSLLEGAVRPAVSVFCKLDPALEITSTEIVLSNIKITGRLSYDNVDANLDSPSEPLATLHNIASNLEAKRLLNDAVIVQKRDAQVTIAKDGKLSLQDIDEHTPARNLIGEFMILANAEFGKFAAENNIPIVFRSQDPPEEHPDLPLATAPEGPAHDYAERSMMKRSLNSLTPGPHAGLGLEIYTQITSPIRRYLDLCNQRQIVNFLANKKYLSSDEYQSLLDSIQDYLARAGQVQKESKRFWLLRYLEQNFSKKKTITGTVIRTGMKNPMVELDEIYIPTLIRTNAKLKRGDELTFKIVHVNARYDELKLEIIN